MLTSLSEGQEGEGQEGVKSKHLTFAIGPAIVEAMARPLRLLVYLNAAGCCCLFALFSLHRSRAARSRVAFLRSD
jgi:hypothetical protein